MEKIKTADKASISITRVKSTKIGLKETEDHKVLFGGILMNSVQLELFL